MKKNIDEMSFIEVRQEISEYRQRDAQIQSAVSDFVSSLNPILEAVNKLRSVPGIFEVSEMPTLETTVEKKSQKQTIIDLIKARGVIYADDLMDALVEKKVIENDDQSKNNIRSVLSRLAFNGIIEKIKTEAGTSWKFLKDE